MSEKCLEIFPWFFRALVGESDLEIAPDSFRSEIEFNVSDEVKFLEYSPFTERNEGYSGRSLKVKIFAKHEGRYWFEVIQ